jgi:hypothetical protein
VDVNAAEDLALEYGVSKLPRILFFKVCRLTMALIPAISKHRRYVVGNAG